MRRATGDAWWALIGVAVAIALLACYMQYTHIQPAHYEWPADAAAPSPGTPSSGTPSPGTPSPGTPSPGTPSPGTPSPGTPSPESAPTARPARLDVNTADVAALEALPGIGPVLAARIVADRAQNGRFTSVEQLRRVQGIGPALLAKLRELDLIEVSLTEAPITEAPFTEAPLIGVSLTGVPPTEVPEISP